MPGIERKMESQPALRGYLDHAQGTPSGGSGAARTNFALANTAVVREKNCDATAAGVGEGVDGENNKGFSPSEGRGRRSYLSTTAPRVDDPCCIRWVDNAKGRKNICSAVRSDDRVVICYARVKGAAALRAPRKQTTIQEFFWRYT